MSLYKGSTCIARTTNVSGKANTWLDNLTDVGEDRLNTSKMYLTGGVSTDEKGYNQLLEMKHSTSSKSGIDIVNINNAEVEIPYTLSKTGSKIVDVAYRDKVIELYEQEGQAGYYTIDETNKNFTLPMGEMYGMIDGKASIDLDNLSEAGEKHFLNKSQITNCLLEVPQRIKYELADGTLTVKAGSVVIVPYGTEDLTAQYPKGATFINENFKVYDTCYTDGKFFVWAELVGDVIRNATSSSSVYERLMYINITANVTVGTIENTSGSSDTSSTSASYNHYNTTTNLIVCKNEGAIKDVIVSLPIFKYLSSTTYNVASISQVFNGMGYIGSTVWVDKGVKGLIPNGRNEDGTLNNVEWLNDKLELRSFTFSGTNNTFGFSPLVSTKLQSGKIVYNETENYNYSGSTKWLLTSFATGNLTDGVISNLQPKQPFRAVDYNDIDGQLVVSNKKIIKSASIAYNGSVTCDLSNYLPNDGNVYEVDCSLWATSGTADGNGFNLAIASDYSSSYHGIAENINRTAGKATYGSGTCKIPVGVGRYIKVINNFPSTAGTSKFDMQAHSYRKVR